MNTNFSVVPGIVELQAINQPTNNDVVLVKDQYRGGMFCWNNASTDVPNAGTIFAANDSTPGNWERVIDQTNTIQADWFGAVPNGVFDSTSALQLALSYISDTLKGGILLLSQGVYKTTDELVVGARTIIRGAGRNSSTIKYTGANSSTLENIIRGKDRVVGKNHNHIGFEDFGITTARDAMNALNFTNLSYAWVKSFTIVMSGVNSNGIYVNDADTGTGPYYCYVENLNFTGGGEKTTTGINFNRLSAEKPRTANAWTVIGGRIAACGTAWNMQGVSHSFIGVYCESIAENVMVIGEDTVPASGLANLVLGVGAENIGTYANIKAKARRNTIIPGYITGAANDFVYPAPDNSNTSLLAGRGFGNKMSNYLEITENQGVRSAVILYAPNGSAYKVLVENDGSVTTTPA